MLILVAGLLYVLAIASVVGGLGAEFALIWFSSAIILFAIWAASIDPKEKK